MFFFRKRDGRRQLIESQRALAFAAGFRCGQEAMLCSFGTHGPEIEGWEKYPKDVDESDRGIPENYSRDI